MKRKTSLPLFAALAVLAACVGMWVLCCGGFNLVTWFARGHLYGFWNPLDLFD